MNIASQVTPERIIISVEGRIDTTNYGEFETGRKLILKSLQPSIREIFDISGFSSIFTIND